MSKILYITKKYEKEVQESIDIKGLDIQYKKLEIDLDCYKHPKEHPNDSINDEVSFYDIIGDSYSLIANEYYLAENDTRNFIKNIYLFLLAKSKSYKHENNGIEIMRKNIKKKHENKTEHEKIMFCAASIGKLVLFEPYGNNLGCEIIKAMYHED